MGGVSALCWFRPRRDDGDGRDDDLGSGQKTVTIVTTVTEEYKLWKGLSKMIECNIMLTEKERYDLLMAKLIDAMRNSGWDTISSLITLNARIMAVGLEAVYRILPDEYKFSIPTECHTHNGDHIPTVRKYVRQAKKYAPIEKRIPVEMIGLPEIEVYRAGEESLDKAAYRISWTPVLMLRDGSMIEQQPGYNRNGISTRVSSNQRRSSGTPMAGRRKRSCNTTASRTLLSLSGKLPL